MTQKITSEQDQRKLPRFHITPCQFHDEELRKNFSVQDLSQGGLAIRLLDRTDLPRFAVGTHHQGILKIEGTKVSGGFQVKYVRGTLIGCEWTEVSAELKVQLEYFSHPKTLGQGLRHYELPESAGQKWYHNPVGVDLLIYQDSTQNTFRWTLYIHQNFILWDSETGVRTGKAVAEDEEGFARGVIRLETRLLEFDPKLDLRFAETAVALLNEANQVEVTLRENIRKQIEGAMV